MKLSISTISAIGLAFAVACTGISAAEAKKDMHIKKVTLKSAIPASFVKGSYKFSCAKWGDCGNYNISF
jgi:uncharacterized alpha/beta hydrolase family protein